jgi:hypothetical protein
MVANASLVVERINAEMTAATKAISGKLAEISSLGAQSAIATSAIDARFRECESSHETNVATITTVQSSHIPSMQVLQKRRKGEKEIRRVGRGEEKRRKRENDDKT